jgi:peptidoglycan/xylan/chitin deacetylase (PgdA/CDA1 family)
VDPYKNKKQSWLKGRLIWFAGPENADEAVPASESLDVTIEPDLDKYNEEKSATLEDSCGERIDLCESIEKNRFAVAVEVPRVEKPGFNFSREFWISSEVVPEVIAPEHRDKAVCMAHTSEMLTREVGSERALKSLGFEPGNDAWMFKRDILETGGDEQLVYDMNKYLSAEKNSIISHTDSPDYHDDIRGLRSALDEASRDGQPITLQCFMEGSSYMEQVIKDAEVIKAESGEKYSELCTHIIYFLGKGFRQVPGETEDGEEVTDYLSRSFGIQPEYKYLVDSARIKIGETIYPNAASAPPLTVGAKVELEDFYFTHHLHGASRVNSFMELIGSGKFVPTSVLKLNTDHLEEQGYLLSESPGDPLLTPEKCLYLSEGENLGTVFREKVSKKKQDWKNYSWYLSSIGFDINDLEAFTTGIPVPNLENLAQYIQIHGGLSVLLRTDSQARIDLYRENHPHDHIVFIQPGDYVPWKLVSNHFEEFSPPLTKQEQKYALRHIDLLNPQIDLAVNKKDQLTRWNAGDYFWFNDDLISQLRDNIEFQRISGQTFVPDTLLAPTGGGPERVKFSEHEKQIIENATIDPEIRRYLILILLNEQKCGWVRDAVTGAVDAIHPFEKSVGLFQVRANREEWTSYYREKYPTFKEYRNALKTDDALNAEVAVRLLKDLTKGYRSFLRHNGEKAAPTDRSFITGVLSGYNRGPSQVFSGMICIAGRDVAEAFDLGLEADLYEIERQEDRVTPEYVSHAMMVEYIGGIVGADPLGISELWIDVASELMEQGVINLTPEQIAKDQEILHRTWPSKNEAAAEYLDYATNGSEYFDPVPLGAQAALLMVFRKNDFLQSELYKEIKKAYQEKTGQELSMLITEQDYYDTKVQNYGLRATRYEQITEITDYSTNDQGKRLAQTGLTWEPMEDLCDRIQGQKQAEISEETYWDEQPPPLMDQPDWWPTNLSLTIDDGPSKDTEQILETLNAKGVKATFYFMGVNIQDSLEYWPVLQRIVETGHRIGYHSMYHNNEERGSTTDFVEMSEEKILDDIYEFQSVLDIALGGIDYQVTAGRCPGGDGTYSPRVKRAFQKAGLYAPHHWENDTKDWMADVDLDPHDLAEQSITDLDSNTILVHEDQNSNFADILPDYLDSLEALQN